MQQQLHLPIEILQTIFEFSPPHFSAVSNIYPPILVCKTWRNLATSTRSLWCAIQIDVSLLGLMGTREGLKLWLGRSGEIRDLHISISRFGDMRKRKVRDLHAAKINIQTLAQSCGRWKSLRCTIGSNRLLDMMMTAIVHAKNIELLHIDGPFSIRFSKPQIPYQFSMPSDGPLFPKAKKIYIHGQYSPYSFDHTPTLGGDKVTSLTLVSTIITAGTFVFLCHALPNLVTLIMEAQVFEGFEGPDTPSEWNSIRHPLPLPKLKTLNVERSGFMPQVILQCGRFLETSLSVGTSRLPDGALSHTSTVFTISQGLSASLPFASGSLVAKLGFLSSLRSKSSRKD
jgi:hypothetical protein